MIKNIIAIILLLFVFSDSIIKYIPNVTPSEIDQINSVLNIDKPTDEVLKKVKPVADLVTNKEDRAKIALFNYEFSERVASYITDSQQLNDVYVKAAKKFFDNSLDGKYPGFSEGLVDIFTSVLTDDNHILSKEEKQSIRDLFRGLAWALIERQ